MKTEKLVFPLGQNIGQNDNSNPYIESTTILSDYKCYIHLFYKIFLIVLVIVSFQHVLHFDVNRTQKEWNLKVNSEISICTAIVLNDHTIPIEEVLPSFRIIHVYTCNSVLINNRPMIILS